MEGERGPPPAAGATPPEGAAGAPPLVEVPLPLVPAASLSGTTGAVARPPEPPVPPRKVGRGVVVFDLDGTILDDISLISHVAADVLQRAFGTPPEEGRIHYLATTGMPFEAQLAQLYPDAPAALRRQAARTFHQRKVQEAYAHSAPFPEVPRMLRRLAEVGWTLVISTGAEREMAELVLEREGLRYWFEAVLGSGQGTKREHLREYRRRYPGAPIFLVGDSRFDMEAALAVEGVIPVARASLLHGWTLAPEDLKRWGARWADYSLAGLPDAVERLASAREEGRPTPRRPPARRRAPRAAGPRAGGRASRKPASRPRKKPATTRRGGGPGPRVSGRGGRPRSRLNPGRGIHSPPG